MKLLHFSVFLKEKSAKKTKSKSMRHLLPGFLMDTLLKPEIVIPKLGSNDLSPSEARPEQVGSKIESLVQLLHTIWCETYCGIPNH